MADAAEFVIGAAVSCSDGAVCGELGRVVIDPVDRTVTHLVVRVTHGHMLDRLVPVGLVKEGLGDGGVRLGCTADQFAKLDAAEELHYLPASGSFAGYGPGQVLRSPFYLLRRGLVEPVPHAGLVTDETVPAGEVDLRRGDRVRASDGEIGQIEGLVVDPASRRVTHVLLQEGHLWGRKQVAIPIDTVTKVDAGVEVKLTKEQVRDLPSVDVEHPDASRE